MQNPKAGGSRRVLDIRPENIDTYTEQDGEQSAQYKIVDAHPIIGGVLDKLAFFRTHASAVWYNKMKNITVLQKLDNLASNIGVLAQLATTDKSSLVNAINELNGKMNSNPWSKLEITNNLEEVFSKPPGIYFHDCQDATDNPLKGTMTLSITVVLNERWGMQYILSSHRMRNRDKSGGVLTEWRVMIQLS